MTDNSFVNDEDRRRFATVVANVWSDESFARRYADVPHEVLAEHGIEHPTSVPAPPVPPRPEGDMSLEQLESVAMAGGMCESTISSTSCVYATMTVATGCPPEMESA
jgi:hypothetical protein